MCKLTREQYRRATFKGSLHTSNGVEYRVIKRNRHYKWYVQEKTAKDEWKHVLTSKVPKSKFVHGTFTDTKAKVKVSFEKPPRKKRQWHRYTNLRSGSKKTLVTDLSTIPAVFKRLLQPAIKKTKRTAGRAPKTPSPHIYEVKYERTRERTRSGGLTSFKIKVYNFTKEQIYAGIYISNSIFETRGNPTNFQLKRKSEPFPIESGKVGTVKVPWSGPYRLILLVTQSDVVKENAQITGEPVIDQQGTLYKIFPVSTWHNWDILVYPVKAGNPNSTNPSDMQSIDSANPVVLQAEQYVPGILNDKKAQLIRLNGGGNPES